MKKTIWPAGAWLLAAALCTPVFAQQATASSGDVEQEAVAALQKMGTYLRTLKAFQVRADTTSEYVLTDGQKIQVAHRTNMLARIPDRLYAEIEGDHGAKTLLYDGKSFTLYAPATGYYATVSAPPTLAQLAEVVQDKYDIDIPLADLFLWGQPDRVQPALTSAADFGPVEIGGVSCKHYAFRQEGLDWQIWIQQGDYPLPRKLVLTTTTDEARPQHESVLTWNLGPAYKRIGIRLSAAERRAENRIRNQLGKSREIGGPV
jgi:hypothetical protein